MAPRRACAAGSLGGRSEWGGREGSAVATGKSEASAKSGRRRVPATRRVLALLVLALVAFLYYRPLVTYLETREALAARAAEVDALRAERRALERRLAAQTSTRALVHEARRLAYVRPGERLFIVKGIAEWRRARAAERAEATIRDDG